VVRGFANIFYNKIETALTYLPDSIQEIEFIEDSLIVFWRFLHCNPHFLEELVANSACLQKILLGVLYIYDTHKKDPLKSNMMYICVFILLTLSGSRDFALSLNEPVYTKLKWDIPDFIQSSYGNLLIQVIYRSIQVGP
jgi:hypothetical protein